mgnify:FL=1
MVEKMKRKRGRPKKEGDTFGKRFVYRENNEIEYMRKTLEEEMGKNGGEVVRAAIEMLYNMHIGWKQ